MTVEAIIALGTSLAALAHSIYLHRRLPPKQQAPITKAELYGERPVVKVTVPDLPKPKPKLPKL